MNREQDWEPVSESQPSGQFACTYGGNFAQMMAINRHQVENFLDIASLDGRVLLQESKARKPQVTPAGINPDGSITGRGSLRWGQKIETEESRKRQNPYFQVEPNEAGWVISVNGNLIQEDLAKKGLAGREMVGPFSKRFEYFTRVGLKETVLKEKLTSEKDKYISGRLWPTIFILSNYQFVILNPSLESATLALNTAFLQAFLNMISKTLRFRELPIDRVLNPVRKTIKTPIELIDTPIELDRTLLALGYLDLQKYFGQPLVKPVN